MVNCLNVKKYILSRVSENFAVSVSQEVSDIGKITRFIAACVNSTPFYTFLTSLLFLSCYFLQTPGLLVV
jgi:hypothetical protein